MEHDRRNDARAPTFIEASVTLDGHDHPCRLKNISASGAQIALDAALDAARNAAVAEGCALALVIQPFAPINATVMWRKAQALGIKFSDDATNIEDVLLGLSAHPSSY